MIPKIFTRGFAVTLLTCTGAANFHVAPGGNDNDNGSEASPFATFKKAQSAVRAINADMTADLHVYIAEGTYYLDEPLNFTSVDSGSNGHRIVWEGTGTQGASISGGIQITNWTLYDEDLRIYSASTPVGLESRHFYADQSHAQRAREDIDRSWFTNVTDGYKIVNDAARFLLTLEGIEHGEIRGINSFTDRSVPISSVGSDSTLIMAQPAFDNNIVGYDTILHPFFDNGFFVENVFALLNEAGEYYLNSTTGTIYYIPPEGAAIEDMYLVLPKLEQLLVLSGTYDDPVHDLTFQNLNYMHTTWNYPSTDVGYADQQTGAYIGLNVSYLADFEASRPFWWQVPGSVQASAAHDITFTNGSLVAVMGGFGIGNDANAHTNGVGLGAQRVEISGMYITETGTNTITVGGVQADAHHPSDPRMINADNLITENIVANNGRTYKSGSGILVTYNDGTEISHNDLSDLPYSGICWGWGWGSNDAGGSDEYASRGLYNYQPRYTTPTVQGNGLLTKNLVHNFGLLLDDLGGFYTLSASPNTSISNNFVFSEDSKHGGAGIYHDEGSRDYVDSLCVFNVTGNTEYNLNGQWLQRNERQGYTTGNLTAHDIAIADSNLFQTGTNEFGDNVFNVTKYSSLESLSPEFKSVVYEAGIPPSQRGYRAVSYRPSPP